MKKILGALITISLLGALAVCVSACSGGGAGPSQNEKTVITPASIAYGEHQMLYVANDLAKDSTCRLYVFENGVLTFRSNSTLVLGDLVDMSDEEIISVCKKADEQSRNEAHDYDEPFFEFVENPEVTTVELITDKSGNNTSREVIAMDECNVMKISEGKEVQGIGRDTSKRIGLECWEIVEPQPIFSSYFGGFHGNGIVDAKEGSKYLLVKIDDPENTSIEWDAVGTEGTTAK